MLTISDVEKDYGVNSKMSVLAQGISEDDTSEEITEVLKTHGRVTKVVRLKQAQAIIEFDSEETVAHLNTRLPLEIPTARDPTLKLCLDSIDKMIALTSQPSSPVKAGPSKSAPDRLDSSELDSSDSGGLSQIVVKHPSHQPLQRKDLRLLPLHPSSLPKHLLRLQNPKDKLCQSLQQYWAMIY